MVQFKNVFKSFWQWILSVQHNEQIWRGLYTSNKLTFKIIITLSSSRRLKRLCHKISYCWSFPSEVHAIKSRGGHGARSESQKEGVAALTRQRCFYLRMQLACYHAYSYMSTLTMHTYIKHTYLQACLHACMQLAYPLALLNTWLLSACTVCMTSRGDATP
jgi:hypothetical protein